MRSQTFCITPHDVNLWMEYSEDRNPVHFDRDAAIAFGVAEPFAHGMLSMFPMKQSVQRVISTGWSLMDIRLSRPVLLDKVYTVTWDANGGGVARPLESPDENSDIAAYCRLGSTNSPDMKDFQGNTRIPIERSIYLESGSLTVGEQKLSEYSKWILLEASAFATFIRLQKSGSIIPKIPVISDVTGSESRKDHSLLHIRHTVKINEDAVATNFDPEKTSLELVVNATSETAVKDGTIISFELISLINGNAAVISCPHLYLRRNRSTSSAE